MSVLFIKKILAFIANNWQFFAVLGLGIAVFMYWNQRTTLIEEQSKQISALIKDKAAIEERCRLEKASLVNQISDQNAAIEAFNQKNSQNQQKVDQARVEVIKIQQKYNEEIRKILSGAKPGDCSTAIKYLVDSAKDFIPSTGETK